MSVESIVANLENIWSSYIVDGMDGLIYIGTNTSYWISIIRWEFCDWVRESRNFFTPGVPPHPSIFHPHHDPPGQQHSFKFQSSDCWRMSWRTMNYNVLRIFLKNGLENRCMVPPYFEEWVEELLESDQCHSVDWRMVWYIFPVVLNFFLEKRMKPSTAGKIFFCRP